MKLGSTLNNVEKDAYSIKQVNSLQHSTIDACSRYVIAPDRLITGPLKNILQCCFEEIKDRAMPRILDLEIRRALMKVGMQGQNELYKGESKTLYSISKSSKYYLLLVILTVLRSSGLCHS